MIFCISLNGQIRLGGACAICDGNRHLAAKTAFLAAMLFGIQIYCDFSGYSDIARGCAKLLGIDLMENFRTPYRAVSIRDFWRRWHISLTFRFTDYVYIPLGGNRNSLPRQCVSILVVFLLSGLWPVRTGVSLYGAVSMACIKFAACCGTVWDFGRYCPTGSARDGPFSWSVCPGSSSVPPPCPMLEFCSPGWGLAGRKVDFWV